MNLPTFCFIVGVFELLFAIPMLVAPRAMTAWVREFYAQEKLLRLVCALFLMLAVLVLVEDPSVGTDVAGLVRLVAWVTAIKCLIFCWLPTAQLQFFDRLLSMSWWSRVVGPLALAVGILFFAAGFALR